MKINAKQLAFLLQETLKSSKRKICIALANGDVKQGEVDMEYVSNPEIDLKTLESYLKIDLEYAILDLRDNALKRPAFKKYLLQDFPYKKASVPKPPKTISLPLALRELLSESVLSEVEKYWAEHWSEYVFTEWQIGLDYKPVFKP